MVKKTISQPSDQFDAKAQIADDEAYHVRRHTQKDEFKKNRFKDDSKDFKKSGAKRNDFKRRDKKSYDFKGGFRTNAKESFGSTKDFKRDHRDRDFNGQTNTPKSDKPKVRYEKIDGRLVAVPIETTQTDKPKKYTVKPKS